MATFNHLFTPIQVGKYTIKNRILVTGHLTHFASTEGLVTDKMIAYHEERAKNGVGFMITESMSIAPTSAQSQYVVNLWDDKCIPMLSELTKRVKAHGTVIVCQLHHMGREMWSEDTRREIVAPSAIACPAKKLVPHELTTKEVKQYVQYHIDAAARALKAGYDGIEIHLAHGYLIHEFNSPLFNQRTDEYGGSIENRIRFAREIIQGVRALDPDKIVGMRVTGDDMHEDGLTQEDYQNICVELAKEGLDYIGLSLGHNVGQIPATFPNMDFPLGFAVYLASGLKRLVDIPIYTSHRINDPMLAENILAEGHADLIGMTRATIADPEMPKKAREGRLDDIRPCIACIQGCFLRLKHRCPISCFGNARVGKEAEYQITPAAAPKKVAVIGGGPSGLEAARVLKERGHEVTLFEKDAELGGMLRRGALEVPNRQELFDVTRWQIRQVNQLGVNVELNHEATVEDIKSGGFDAVIVATGAYFGDPSEVYSPDVPHINLYQALDLEESDVQDKRVLVVDKEYNNKAMEIAEKFGMYGAEVVISTADADVGSEMAYVNKVMSLPRLAEYDVKYLTHAHVVGVEGNAFTFEYGGWERELEFDLVVMVDQLISNNALALELEAEMPDLEIHLIGNCLAPRQTQDLIHDAMRVSLEV